MPVDMKIPRTQLSESVLSFFPIMGKLEAGSSTNFFLNSSIIFSRSPFLKKAVFSFPFNANNMAHPQL
jgi:hypothetical protein